VWNIAFAIRATVLVSRIVLAVRSRSVPCQQNDILPSLIIIIIIIIIIITAIEFSLSGSSPYSSADKANKNMYT
jgi:hypothetical protein